MERDIKKMLFNACREAIHEKIRALRQAISEAQHDANEETKSSSGDKYETGRAMAQLEIEKLSGQLRAALELKDALGKVNIGLSFETARPGALVVTDHEKFFIAVGLGRVAAGDSACIAVGPASPIGQQLLGMRQGESFRFNGRTYVIRELI